MFLSFLVSSALAFSGLVINETSKQTARLFCEQENGTIRSINEETLLDHVGELGMVVETPREVLSVMTRDEISELYTQSRRAYYHPDKKVRDEYAAKNRSAIVFGGFLETCVAIRGYAHEVPIGANERRMEDRWIGALERHGFDTNLYRLDQALNDIVRARIGFDVAPSEYDYMLAQKEYFGEKYSAVIDEVFPVLTNAEKADEIALGSATVTVLHNRRDVKRALTRFGEQDEFNAWSIPRQWSKYGFMGIVFNHDGRPVSSGAI